MLETDREQLITRQPAEIRNQSKEATYSFNFTLLVALLLGSSDRKMNLETEIPVMTHCKEPALTSKMTLTFFESVNGLILY